MHWGTFPAIMPGDPAVFAQRVEAAGKTRVVTLQPGDHYEF
jgi:L-ascorbate metabolism protein UlaG (beta-lactamase superfamily)